MKIKLSFIFIVFLCMNAYSQGKIFWRPEFRENAEAFMQFVDTFTSLNYNFKKLYRKNKKRFFFEKTFNTFKFGDYEFCQFSFHPVKSNNPNLNSEIGFSPELLGKAQIVLKKNKVYAVWGYLGLLNKYGIESDDSTVYKLMRVNFECKHCTRDNRTRVTFYRYFSNLDSTEKKFITDLVSEKYSKQAIQEYTKISGEVVVFKQKKNLDRYELFANPHGFFNSGSVPNLKYISKLFAGSDFSNYFKLIYSQSPAFNWFVAEALYFYNSKENLLNLEEKEAIDYYNGKHGFVQFRTNEVLMKLYK